MKSTETEIDEARESRVVVPSGDPVPAGRYRHYGWLALAASIAAVTLFGSFGPPMSSRPIDTDTDLATPSIDAPPPRDGWTETRLEGTGGFTAVSDHGPRIVAVGTGRRVDAFPLVYTSTDGLDWSEALTPAEAGDALTSVAWNGTRYIAAGFRPDLDSGSPPEAMPIVWVSEGGGAWRRVVTTGLPERGTISGMVVVGTTLTAIGWEGPGTFEPLDPPPPTSRSRVWVSEDGEAWTDVTPDHRSMLFSDVDVIDGEVVVSGSIDGSPTVWSPSSDGEWSHSSLSEGTPGRWVVSVTGTSDRTTALVRAIDDIEGIVTVWSVREEHWTQLANRGSPDSAGWIRILDGAIYAGAGFTRTVFPDGPELWKSELGTLWTGIEITRGASPWPPTVIADITELDGGLIAYGSRGGAPVVWHAPPG